MRKKGESEGKVDERKKGEGDVVVVIYSSHER